MPATSEQIISGLIAALLAVLGWIIGSRNKVTVAECKLNREEVLRNHAMYCPQNRHLLTEEDHDKDCLLKLQPVNDKLDVLTKKVDMLLERRENARN